MMAFFRFFWGSRFTLFGFTLVFNEYNLPMRARWTMSFSAGSSNESASPAKMVVVVMLWVPL